MDIHIDAVMRLHLSKNIERSWPRYFRIYQSSYLNHLSSQRNILNAIKIVFLIQLSSRGLYIDIMSILSI